MKKFLLIIAVVLFVFAGCDNSYDQMIEDFNSSYFSKGYKEPEPYTTDSSSFDEGQMLDEIVSMIDGSVTMFTAPEGGEGCVYEWKAHIPCKDSNGKDYMKETVVGNERVLCYTAPGVFNSDKENKLTLTITEASGKTYTDTAMVFITIE